MKTISNEAMCNYLHIKDKLIAKRVTLFTQSEMAKYLEVSRKTISDFETGKHIDFILLSNYADILGLSLYLYLDK
jgi:DNA-binding XRE family transcriptional regulator